MANFKKIAGVGINMDLKHDFDMLVNQALKTKEFYKMPVEKAKKLIEKELRANGFTRTRRSSKKKSKSKQITD